MPSKKKKYNSRFPPARIKKIMQKDEEVGKVAQAVPVIISRALELFVESLLEKAMKVTTSRNAKTLSPSHLKQCIVSETRFDFLRDLVKGVPDIQSEGGGSSSGETEPQSAQLPIRRPSESNIPEEEGDTSDENPDPKPGHSTDMDNSQEKPEEGNGETRPELDLRTFPHIRHSSAAATATSATLMPVSPQPSTSTPVVPVVQSSTSAPVAHQSMSAPVAHQSMSAPVAHQLISAPVVHPSTCAPVVHPSTSAPVGNNPPVIVPNFYQEIGAIPSNPGYQPVPLVPLGGGDDKGGGGSPQP